MLLKGSLILMRLLLHRWFLLSWRRSPRLSSPSSQSLCAIWGRSRAPCVGGRPWGRGQGGGRVSEGKRMKRKVDRTQSCHPPSLLPPGFGRRWGIICQWGAIEQFTPRKPPCLTYDLDIIWTCQVLDSTVAGLLLFVVGDPLYTESSGVLCCHQKLWGITLSKAYATGASKDITAKMSLRGVFLWFPKHATSKAAHVWGWGTDAHCMCQRQSN